MPPGDQRRWRYYGAVRTRIEKLTGDSLWWDVVEVIIAHTPEIATNCCHIIWLRRMRYGIKLIEKDALRCELRKGGLYEEVR